MKPRHRWLPLVILFFLNLYLEHRGAYEPVALASYDWFQTFMRARAPSPKPLVTVFTLAGSDQSDFAGDRSLEETRILNMIEIIACGRPSVIGVDWRSGNWSAARLSALAAGPAAGIPIVWARAESESGEPTRVAGGVRLPPNWSVGVAQVVADSDRAVRRHERWLPNRTETFSWKLARQFCQSSGASRAQACDAVLKCTDSSCEREALLDYTMGADKVDHFDSDALPRIAAGRPVKCNEFPWTEQAPNPYLKDRVVLIGDASTADQHYTAFERKPGVMIMAHAIQADLLGSQLREPPRWIIYVLDVLGIFLVIVVYRFERPFFVLFLNVVGIPVAVVAFSYAAFASWHHWFNFLPLLGGVSLHQQYEQAVEANRLRAEVLKLGAELEHFKNKHL